MHPYTDISSLVLAYTVLLVGLWTWKRKPLRNSPGLIPWFMSAYIVLMFHIVYSINGLVLSAQDISARPFLDTTVILLWLTLEAYIILLCVINIPWQGYWKLLRFVVVILAVSVHMDIILLGWNLDHIVLAGISALSSASDSYIRYEMKRLINGIDHVAAILAIMILIAKLGEWRRAAPIVGNPKIT